MSPDHRVSYDHVISGDLVISTSPGAALDNVTATSGTHPRGSPLIAQTDMHDLTDKGARPDYRSATALSGSELVSTTLASAPRCESKQ